MQKAHISWNDLSPDTWDPSKYQILIYLHVQSLYLDSQWSVLPFYFQDNQDYK